MIGETELVSESGPFGAHSDWGLVKMVEGSWKEAEGEEIDICLDQRPWELGTVKHFLGRPFVLLETMRKLQGKRELLKVGPQGISLRRWV